MPVRSRGLPGGRVQLRWGRSSPRKALARDRLRELLGALCCGFYPLLDLVGEFEEDFDAADDFVLLRTGSSAKKELHIYRASCAVYVG